MTLMSTSTLTKACPACGESKRVKVTVSPVSERFPKPIWRRECGRCDHRWIEDENAEPVLSARYVN